MFLLKALEVLMDQLKTLLRGPKGFRTELEWLEEAKMEMESDFGISRVEILTCNDTRILAQAGPSLKGHWVLLSKAVLELLPQEEVIAVLAHEMTHVACLWPFRRAFQRRFPSGQWAFERSWRHQRPRKRHQLLRGFMILDFYRLMLFWRDASDAQVIAATVVMWLLLNLRSRSQELEARSKEFLVPKTDLGAEHIYF